MIGTILTYYFYTVAFAISVTALTITLNGGKF